MDEKTVFIVVIAVFIGLIALLVSRSGENHGLLRPSGTATENFQASRMDRGKRMLFSRWM